MKKILFFSVLGTLYFSVIQGQSLKNLIKKNTNQDSSKSGNSSRSILDKLPNLKKTGLTNDEIISGLKEALQVGTERGTQKLSSVDGFFKDAVIKILMPAEAVKAEKTLRNLGMGK